MIVLVCGGRDYHDKEHVYAVLDGLMERDGIDAVIHGGATGADMLATLWAVERNVTGIAFPADWDKYGKAAGPIRNQEMLDKGSPDMLLAFPGGRGTNDMMGRAERAGVPVTIAVP